MAKMIDDLLELSHTTGAELHMSQVDLSALASSILNGLADADPDRKVVTLVEPGCRVTADLGLIKIVLQNLLRNAWKFTGQRDQAQIEFGCTHRKIGSVFHVRDNGAGFDPHSSDRLFKPFQRLHSANKFPGIGIGLATIRRIIERHGGEVWAEGEVGKGATFYFTLQSPEA
jgi:light-regulated signal transduction histidine kinase (bacteriophytochrome)